MPANKSSRVFRNPEQFVPILSNNAGQASVLAFAQAASNPQPTKPQQPSPNGPVCPPAREPRAGDKRPRNESGHASSTPWPPGPQPAPDAAGREAMPPPPRPGNSKPLSYEDMTTSQRIAEIRKKYPSFNMAKEFSDMRKKDKKHMSGGREVPLSPAPYYSQSGFIYEGDEKYKEVFRDPEKF